MIRFSLLKISDMIQILKSIWYYKQQNDAKDKAIISFNHSNTGLMMKAKVLIIKKNSDWYFDSDFSFHMISEKDLFIKYKKWW